ncbi:MAG: hypothetical protein J5871_01290 [Bacteroidales bacterium]|nr:hypothetical protein [Bacteroidales bacterium]
MRKILPIILAALLCSCGPASRNAADALLLQAVPSDALTVVRASRLETLLPMSLDSTHVLRGLDYGNLGKSRAVLSLSYVSRVEPLLVVDDGKARPDTGAAACSLLAQARAKGLHHAYRTALGRNLLLLSTVELLIPTVERHLAVESSVLEAPGFAEALDKAPEEGWMIRTGGLARLLKAGFGDEEPLAALRTRFTDRQMAAFLHNAADWLLLARGTGAVTGICDPADDRYFCNFLQHLSAARLSLPVPEGTQLLLAAPLTRSWRKAFDNYLDARSRYERRVVQREEVARRGGMNPLGWEAQARPAAIARLCFGDNDLVLLVCEGEAPPSPAYLRVLYPDAFAPREGAQFHREGKLLLCGEEPAISAYLAADKTECKFGDVRFVLRAADCTFVCDKNGIYRKQL